MTGFLGSGTAAKRQTGFQVQSEQPLPATVPQFELNLFMPRLCTQCQSSTDLHLVTIFAQGQSYDYSLLCPQCRRSPKTIDLSIPLSLITPQLFVELYSLEKVSSIPPPDLSRLLFGTEIVPSVYLERALELHHHWLARTRASTSPRGNVDVAPTVIPSRHSKAAEQLQARLAEGKGRAWTTTQRAAYERPATADSNASAVAAPNMFVMHACMAMTNYEILIRCVYGGMVTDPLTTRSCSGPSRIRLLPLSPQHPPPSLLRPPLAPPYLLPRSPRLRPRLPHPRHCPPLRVRPCLRPPGHRPHPEAISVVWIRSHCRLPSRRPSSAARPPLRRCLREQRAL